MKSNFVDLEEIESPIIININKSKSTIDSIEIIEYEENIFNKLPSETKNSGPV